MKYIEVVGVMGTGKTSLAKLFNEHADCHIIVESEDDLKRMFFTKEYLSNPEKYGFEGTLNFTAFHLNRIKESLHKLAEDSTVLVDASILCQYAYSKGQVSDKEMAFIENMIELSYTKLPRVDLRIVTEVPIETHIQRIKQRGRDSEAEVPVEFLIKTQSLIDESIRKFGGDVPTLRLNGANYNWVDNEQDKQEILRLAHKKLGL